MMLIQKAIVQKDDKFLILLRSPDSRFFPEHWDFPGGTLVPNEEPFAGIEREIIEETGLTVKELKVVATYDMDLSYKDKLIPQRFTIYSTELLSGDVILSHEHAQFKWATKEETLQLKIEPFMQLYFEEHFYSR